MTNEARRVSYDEFSFFGENIAEYSLGVSANPRVSRINHSLEDGRHVSALQWGSAPAKIVFVHGSAQNAHTWDTVCLALGESILAVDLPGHGHSSWRDDGDYTPRSLALDIALIIERHAPDAKLVCGMSLGGLTTLALAYARPDLVNRLMMVDITPGVTPEKAKAITDFVNGPQSFPSFDDLLARTIEHNPTRSESSLRRGILHNARQLDDLSWAWRYDRRSHPRREPGTSVAAGMWEMIERLPCPLTLVRGGVSPVVDDADVAELQRRKPDAVVHVVEGAGHSVQGDRPRELADLVRREL
ncbi:MAG: alpha/beta hydrolase [Actinobacteria bacterium]|nr:alpha/beta hydrolase [Actinomycetota bacterium]